jgi:hypothetical protein
MHETTTSSAEIVQARLIHMIQNIKISDAQLEREIAEYFAANPVSGSTGSGSAITGYVYDREGSVAAAWVINHNLNKYPQVALIDDQGNAFDADVFYSNLNQVTVVFAVPTSGKAVLT